MIKIFYTKKDRDLVKRLTKERDSERLEKEKAYEIIKNKEFNYLSEKNKYENLYNEALKVNKHHQEIVIASYNKIDELKIKLKKFTGRNGGLTKQNNKLKLENETLKKEIENFKKSKWLVKEEKPEKSKNIQKMQIKSSSRKSQIIKKVAVDE